MKDSPFVVFTYKRLLRGRNCRFWSHAVNLLDLFMHIHKKRLLPLLRPIHTRGFAPGACSRGTLREQSSSVCTNDFMGILHPREQNFHPAKCSTILNWLNIWEQAPGANWANLKTLPRVYWHVQNEPGACSVSKTPRVYRALALLGNSQFPLPFIYPNKWNSYSSIYLKPKKDTMNWRVKRLCRGRHKE